ncbi:MAG TPA: MDR family oxidoreductase [Ktedonobacterales bacterium]|nr:MDR family oxidoreductase [Ktedonobacterales bacterium]
MPDSFKALLLTERDGQVQAAIETLPRDALPPGDVLVAVEYSGLNYKDGLAVLGKNKVVRSYPMVPGIDFAGTVAESQSSELAPGDRVVLTGWGVGEQHWGGFAQLARVKSGWLVKIPDALSTRDAMAIGTAGFTAMLCAQALEDHGLTPGAGGDVLVTGASGGVGSMAVALLARLGYSVAAATGRSEEHDYLRSLGAGSIIARDELAAPASPMGSARWTGAVDTVGGDTLAGVIRTLAPNASVATCGNAGGFALNTSVLPFILRGVNLLGINSLPVPAEKRRKAWARIAEILPQEDIRRTMSMYALAEVPDLARQILDARVRGHIVIDVNA